jgi:hypothetical protein
MNQFLYKSAIFLLFMLAAQATPAQTIPIYRPDHEANPAAARKQINPSAFADNRERLLHTFAFLDDFEAYFTDVKYLNILGKLPELKIKFKKAVAYIKSFQHLLTPAQRILTEIYVAKYNLFEGLGNIMKNMRLDSGYKSALMRSGLAALSLYNKIIDQFREPVSFTGQALQNLQNQVRIIPKRLQKYRITSKYLKLGGEKIPGGNSVMVLDIINNKALVLFMGPTLTNRQIEGPISLRDLEKRTTWEKANQIFYED